MQILSWAASLKIPGIRLEYRVFSNRSMVFPFVSKILFSVVLGCKFGYKFKLFTEITMGGKSKEVCNLSTGEFCKLQHIAGESNLFLQNILGDGMACFLKEKGAVVAWG